MSTLVAKGLTSEDLYLHNGSIRWLYMCFCLGFKAQMNEIEARERSSIWLPPILLLSPLKVNPHLCTVTLSLQRHIQCNYLILSTVVQPAWPEINLRAPKQEFKWRKRYAQNPLNLWSILSIDIMHMNDMLVHQQSFHSTYFEWQIKMWQLS